MNAPLAPSGKRAIGYQAQSLRVSGRASEANHTIRVRPEALDLLSEVMARLHGLEMPVVQFISVSEAHPATEVAGSFAQAAAARLGRTLLVRLPARKEQPCALRQDTASLSTISRGNTREHRGGNPEIVPDSIVPGLCHAQFGGHFADALHLMEVAAETWLDRVALDFKLVVIESGPPARYPGTLKLATRCHGSILVVTAGTTSLAASRTVMRQLQLVGGTVLGAVLQDAPPPPRLRLLPWRHRASYTSAR